MELPSDEKPLKILCAMVQKFRDTPHMELEVRLGTCKPKEFHSGVSYEYILSLYKAMTNEESLPLWSSAPSTQNFRYTYFDDNIRVAYFNTNQPAEYYQVRRIDPTLDMKCPIRPYGLRFSLKEEKPIDKIQVIEPAIKIRNLTRSSFQDGVWRYDFSKVGTGKTSEEACQNRSYHIELELLRDEEYLKQNNNRQIALNILGKARDLLGRYSQDGVEEELTLNIA